MAEAHHPATSAPESSSASRGDGNEVADFECNICFELAQDPVITLCGHLYCWPCLYKWLKGHSQSHECPVCKALIDEEKVIPLYGRGKTPLIRDPNPCQVLKSRTDQQGRELKEYIFRIIILLVLLRDSWEDLYRWHLQVSATLECLPVLEGWSFHFSASSLMEFRMQMEAVDHQGIIMDMQMVLSATVKED